MREEGPSPTCPSRLFPRVPPKSRSPEEHVERPLHFAHKPSSSHGRPAPWSPWSPWPHTASTLLLRLGESAKASRLFVARGQRVDTGIVEKSVVAVSPGVGLWREGGGSEASAWGSPAPPPSRPRGPVYKVFLLFPQTCLHIQQGPETEECSRTLLLPHHPFQSATVSDRSVSLVNVASLTSGLIIFGLIPN